MSGVALLDGRRHGKLVADYSLPAGTLRGSSALKVFVRLRPGSSLNEGTGAPLAYTLKDTNGIILQSTPSAVETADEARDLNDGASISGRSTAPSRPGSARGGGGGVDPRDRGSARDATAAERVGLESVGGRGTVDHVYSFSRIFDVDTDQDEVFRLSASDVVQHAFRGYHACIFAYGQTGSGKTHTMYGPNGGDAALCAPHARGIIPRAADALFAEALARAPFCDTTIRASLLEIYCDKIRDLGCAWEAETNNTSDRGGGRSSPQPAEAVAEARRKAALALRTSELHARAANERHGTIAATDHGGLPARYAAENLELHEDANGAVYVKGQSTHAVRSAADVMSLINGGFRLRATHETRMNAVSSRSHTVLTLTVTAADRGTGQTTAASLHFVDLAGSERLARSESTGQRLAEAQAINLSLTCLGKVVSALGAGAAGSHVPFRDSKLTRLLSPALGGSSYTTLVATLHARAIDTDECLSTLAFAARCQAVMLRPRINVLAPGAEDVAVRLRALESETTVLRHRLVVERLAGSLRIMRLLADAGVAGVLRPGGLFEAQPQNVRIGISHAEALSHPFVRRATSMLVAEPTEEDLEIYESIQEQRAKILTAISAARESPSVMGGGSSRPGSAGSLSSRPSSRPSSARGEGQGQQQHMGGVTVASSRPGSAGVRPGSAAGSAIVPISLAYAGAPLTDDALMRAIDAANGSLSTLPGGGLHPNVAGVGKGGGFVTAQRPLAIPAVANGGSSSGARAGGGGGISRPSSAAAAAASAAAAELQVPQPQASTTTATVVSLSIPVVRAPSPTGSFTNSTGGRANINRVSASQIPKSQLPVFGGGSPVVGSGGGIAGIRVAVTPLSSVSPQKSPTHGQTQVIGVTTHGTAHGSSPPKWSAVGGAALGAAPALLRDNSSSSGGGGGGGVGSSEYLELKNRLREVKKELTDMTDQRDEALARLSGLTRAGRIKETELYGAALEAVRSSRDKLADNEKHHKKQLEAVLEGSNIAKDAATRVAMDTPRDFAKTLMLPSPRTAATISSPISTPMPLGVALETMQNNYSTALRKASAERENHAAALARAGMVEREALSSAINDVRAAARNTQDAALRREHALRADIEASKVAVAVETQRALSATARAAAAELGVSLLSTSAMPSSSSRSFVRPHTSSSSSSSAAHYSQQLKNETTTAVAVPVTTASLLSQPFRNAPPVSGVYPGGVGPRPASASSAVLAMREAAIESGSTAALLKTAGSGSTSILATSVSSSVRHKLARGGASSGMESRTSREGIPPPSPLRIVPTMATSSSSSPPPFDPDLSIRIPGAANIAAVKSAAIEKAARIKLNSLMNNISSGSTSRLAQPVSQSVADMRGGGDRYEISADDIPSILVDDY